MSPFLLYIARAGLYLSLFYAFFLLVMRRTTFFRLNRFVLLAGSYLCLLLPFIRFRTVTISGIVSDLTTVAAGTESEGLAAPAAFSWQDILLAFYIIGALVTLTLYGISAWKMVRLIRKGESLEREGCRLVIMDEDMPSFSWGRKVVISRKDLEENPAIFTHELMHVQCRHSLDLLLFLPVQILFWWNPLVWITREELRLLHEYEADEGVVHKGIDAMSYQLLLVRKAVGDKRFSMASGFQHAKLKNRIEMMLKPASFRWMRWSYLVMIPVLAACMFACNPAKDGMEPAPVSDYAMIIVDAVPFSQIDHKPTFNGGDAQEFAKWVGSRLRYPVQARQDGIQGRVTMTFKIGTDGGICDIRVLRGIREDLDAEAVRVVSASPRWEPGIQNGKAVPVTYTFPITYIIK